jgi:hypothetical protein
VNHAAAEKIANAVLYEGYLLYPYRPSSTKNHQRWTFGTLYPAAFDEVRRGSERSAMHVECLAEGEQDVRLDVRVRFLQMAAASTTEQAWSDSVERIAEFHVDTRQPTPPLSFAYPAGTADLQGSLRFSIEHREANVVKLCFDLLNDSVCAPVADRDRALTQSLLSAHMILELQSGQFISLIDPPGEYRELAAGCKNAGCFPVLVGETGQRTMLLCSPIILYDYPQIAPESAGDFFDGTEMDEMLTLRVITMTDDEKREMMATGERARDLLQRTEQTARHQLMRTHGIIRNLRPVTDHD